MNRALIALAGALVALLDTEPSVEKLHDRIRQWGQVLCFFP